MSRKKSTWPGFPDPVPEDAEKKGLFRLIIFLKVFSEKSSLVIFSVNKRSKLQVSHCLRLELWGKIEGQFSPVGLIYGALSDRGFCGVGEHSHKKAAILVTYTGGSNLSCAYVCEGAHWMSNIVLSIGIFRYFSTEMSSGVGSLRWIYCVWAEMQ